MIEKSMIKARNLQSGLTLLSAIVVMAFLAGCAMVVIKVMPSFVENRGIDADIQHSLAEGHSESEIRILFDKGAETGYIDTINGKDLEIEKTSDGHFTVSYSYTKKIGLYGPVSLLIDYTGKLAQ